MFTFLIGNNITRIPAAIGYMRDLKVIAIVNIPQSIIPNLLAELRLISGDVDLLYDKKKYEEFTPYDLWAPY